jgi:hypothetical protein
MNNPFVLEKDNTNGSDPFSMGAYHFKMEITSIVEAVWLFLFMSIVNSPRLGQSLSLKFLPPH